MCWQGSMSFNSVCTPGGSTQASCACVSSLGSDSRDQNNMRTSRDTIKTSERPRQDSLGYITRGEVCYERRQAFCALSLSNTTMANALVSHRVALWCCWAQLAVWAAMETEREPTRSLQLCFQIKGKLKAPANFVTFFFLVWKWAHTLTEATSQRQERMRGKDWVSKQETVRGRWKKKGVSSVHVYWWLPSIWAKDRKCVSSCLIMLEQQKLKDRHGVGAVFDRSACFNCFAGVLNEEVRSWTCLIPRV